MSGIINRVGARSGVIGGTHTGLELLESSRSQTDTALLAFDNFKNDKYLFYKIIGFLNTTSNGDELKLQLRAGSTTITTDSWYYGSQGYGNTSLTTSYDNANAYMRLSNACDIDFGHQCDLTLRFQNTTSKAIATVSGHTGIFEYDDKTGWRMNYGIYATDNSSINGFCITFGTGDITMHDFGVWGMKG